LHPVFSIKTALEDSIFLCCRRGEDFDNKIGSAANLLFVNDMPSRLRHKENIGLDDLLLALLP
jgi:hypothetical protein